ncbi:MAG: DegT/DnrJ/EryC1/StrS family aminotransferase [Proteobacteria bacterium]|nr:DegT/DnrJ/EryC1/StrS family aminotransferase [Pseudomonadota bacterium]
MQQAGASELRLSAPDVGEGERAAVDAVLRRDQLSLGPELGAFEAALAGWVGARHAVAVASGTAALVLALQACELGPGDEVIVPSFTFPATVNAVALVGAQPVIVDVDAESWNLDLDAAAAAITAKTRALLPVDVLGLPAPRAPLRALTQRPDRPLALIEDAACALGASAEGVRCGGDSRLACFSFHPRKIITTGEGGAILTDDAVLAARLRRLRNHGRDDQGAFVDLGGNARLSELGAALGRVQLSRLDVMLAGRLALAARYRQRLGSSEALALQHVPPGISHNYQTFAVFLRRPGSRQAVIAGLAARGIQSGPATYAVHRQPPYAGQRAAVRGPLPVADRLAEQALALPLHHRLAMDDVDRVCDALLALVG